MLEKVSIIVPMYNAEKTIKTCIESIISQTYKNIEIIVINDGSIDQSLDLVKNFDDSRINLITIENSGPSLARNLGIKKATGTYVQFVDSDDYLEPDMTEFLVNEIIKKDCDWVIDGYYIHNNDRIRPILFKKRIYENKVIRDQILNMYQEGLLNSLWNKLYKIEHIDTLFNTEVKNGEDLIFNLEYIKNINTISVVNNCHYHYINQVSDHNLSGKHHKDAIKYLNLQYKALINLNTDKKSQYVDLYLREFLRIIRKARRCKISYREFKDILHDTKEYCNLTWRKEDCQRIYTKIIFFMIRKRFDFALKICASFMDILYSLKNSKFF